MICATWKRSSQCPMSQRHHVSTSPAEPRSRPLSLSSPFACSLSRWASLCNLSILLAIRLRLRSGYDATYQEKKRILMQIPSPQPISIIGDVHGQLKKLVKLLQDAQLVDAELSWKADRKSTRLNSSHDQISYAVFCLKKK